MIGIILKDNLFEQDIRELLMAFYPGEAFVHDWGSEAHLYVEGSFSDDKQEYRLNLLDGERKPAELKHMPDLEAFQLPAVQKEMKDYLAGRPLKVHFDGSRESKTEIKNQIKRRLYYMLSMETGKGLPWGTLTGIRPTKIAMTRLENGSSEEEIRKTMKEMYLTSKEKAELSIEIAKRERELISAIDIEHGYSLYIGIPFCPTTCLYCSFTSYPIGIWNKRMDEYLLALFHEMEYTAKKMKGRTLDTVYFGGGTPTSLSAENLDRLLCKLKETFDFSTVKEFTVEAGRPDSITKEKLEVLKRHKVDRISINPQTMKQETLDLIGRRHTVDMVRECFHMARECGFDNINMDLIIGLPGESADDVRFTMEEIKKLRPDSITVHSLAIKRAARLNMFKEKYQDLKIVNTQEMIDLTALYAREMGLEPYYLYRQKNMAGNFENVGYASKGKACIYNILIMEEKQTIIGCGAGTTTKVVIPSENRLERAENVKDVEAYIGKIDEMTARKEKVLKNCLQNQKTSLK